MYDDNSYFEVATIRILHRMSQHFRLGLQLELGLELDIGIGVGIELGLG
jgi:hypothetical protein